MEAGLKRALEDKVYAGVRLNRDDGLALYASDDLAWLGRLAHHRRTELNNDRVMFGLNRHLHLTNVPQVNCEYCSFRSAEDDPAEDDAAEDKSAVDTSAADDPAADLRASAMAPGQLTELNLIDEPSSEPPWVDRLRLIRELAEARPDTGLKGYNASQLHRFEEISARSAGDLLDGLIDAGWRSFAAAGIEVFDAPGGIGWPDWSRIHRLVHQEGLRTPSTMGYGRGEQHQDRVDHVLRVRELQDETGGFTVFTPIPVTHHAQIRAQTEAASPADSIKTFAVTRLLLDNVAHLGCFWGPQGASLAQLLLNFGVDELHGTVIERESPPPTGDLPRAELLELIWDGGFRPVERDANYKIVREHEPPVPLAERRAEPQKVWA